MPIRRLSMLLAAVASAGLGTAFAQMEGDRGVAPIDSSSNLEVSHIDVDVSAKDAEAARHGGWRLAQRKAWTQLSQRLGRGGGMVSDGTLDSIVSAIVVEREEVGPTRYIARLGVLFDRARTGALLGVSFGGSRSAPMLVIPVQWSGGVASVFEQRTDWQEAWARFRTGNSAIDYVRPAGTGPDSLLLNLGQTERPGRGWWRQILAQYGATNVLIPTARIFRQYPGGPVIGVFEARWGPDNRLIDRAVLRVAGADGLPALLDAGVARIDDAYSRALSSGVFRVDPGLSFNPNPTPTPTPTETPTPTATDTPAAFSGPGTALTIQFETPTASSVANGESALRSIPGVAAAATTSLALGGTSVMRVLYSGPPEALRAALEARGYQVEGSGATLRIRRAPLPPPATAPDTAPAG